MTACSNTFDQTEIVCSSSVEECDKSTPFPTVDSGDAHTELVDRKMKSLQQMNAMHKMNSTGMILTNDEMCASDMSPATNNTDCCSDNDSDDNLTQVVTSFQMMNRTSHMLTTDLESFKIPRKQLLDSHTSYRRALEQDITQLKLQLTEAQAKADTLQNDVNYVAKEYRRSEMTLQQVTMSFDESRRLAEGLATVVTHLQSNAKESATERSELHSKLDENEKEKKRVLLKFKALKNENKKLKKRNFELNAEMEGKSMEIQGLKSENEWLKKQQSQVEKNRCESDVDDPKVNEGQVMAVLDEHNFNTLPMSDLRPRSRRNTFEGIVQEMETKKSHESPFIITSSTQKGFNDAQETEQHNYTSLRTIRLQSSDCAEEAKNPVFSLPSSLKKKGDRRTRRKSSVGVNKFFNVLASKHIQGNLEESEDDSVTSAQHSLWQRKLKNSSTIIKDSSHSQESTNKLRNTPQEDRVILPNTKDESTKSEDRYLSTPLKWNWWWKNEKTTQDNENEGNEVSGSPQRNIPWFASSDEVSSSHGSSDQIRDQIVGDSIHSIEKQLSSKHLDCSSGFWQDGNMKTLVPKRLENISF